ncbi:CPSF A subunit region-domain-containing protein [Myxozyma melibiosi]|uniref:CPSF A subunit region-domain-containing protein n=1 Tax=Myxozyma melibiosi TaxID=54550 RepID=A0ABR1F1J5_9ASCO
MSMYLYALTLVPPSAVTASIIGQFSGQRSQEIIIAEGSNLHLYKPDANAGKLVPLVSYNLFGVVRTIVPFRVAGASKDYVIVGSDSGRIAILEYKPDQSRFVKVHLETFGKTGVRRVVPGEYLAVDPKGRATMIASVEKNKLVYILNRDSQANITISSPLEAHKPRCLLYDLIGLDVGYDNPIFAALEIDYSECDLDSTGKAYTEVQKMLTYYELDLGLNHVVRIWSDVVDRNSSFLLPVPGGADGPSGVLVCTEGFLVYRHMNKRIHKVPIPRRRTPFDDPSRKRIIVCGVVHKMKSAFFFLLQSDEGDLFKVTIDYNVQGVQNIKIKYFDTVPVAKSLNILKSGFLFVSAEGGSHMFYQFEKLGDDDDETEFSSADYTKGEISDYPTAFFHPRPLDNLVLVDIIDSLSPLVNSEVANLTGEDAPQIYALAGQGARSSFRTIRHGLEVTEIVASELPGEPIAVWTTRLTATDEYDAYIVLSFTNATLILSIGETVEEVTDSGFLSSTPTLAVQQLGEDSLVQVHPKGIRHISADKEVNEWEAPLHTVIVAAATNSRQVAVALSTTEIVYFELDDEGQLNEYQDRQQMGAAVTSISLGDVPEGKVRNSFLAVGCEDSTVRIISLDPENTLESMSVQALTAAPTALQIMVMPDSTFPEAQRLLDNSSTLYLHIGLHNGVYLRAVLDSITGQLSDTQTQFLGPKPVKLFKVEMQGQPTVLALSSRSWLAYTQDVSFKVTPLVYEPLEYGSGFCSEQCAEGVVGIEGSNLRIFTMEKLTDNIKQDIIPLRYTPRQMTQNPYQPLYYVAESDNSTLSPSSKEKLLATSSKKQQQDFEELPAEDFGNARYTGKWASCIEVVDPIGQEITSKIELEDDEAAFSIVVCSFSEYQKRRREEEDEEEEEEEKEEGKELDVYVVVGTAKNVSLIPKNCSAGYLRVYKASEDGRSLEFIHATEVEQPPICMTEFQGRLLVGIGATLRAYDMGMKRLLRKAEYRNRALNAIVTINVSHNRVIIGDSQQSVTYLVYRHQEHKFLPFVDDTIARHTTCATMLDYATVVGGDKFGNLWVVRCPEKVSWDADEDNGAQLMTARPFLNGAPDRLELVAHYFVGDIPTSVHKTQLVSGGREVVLYTGIQGTIGIIAPFASREDVEFFQQLEGQMRTENPPLAGRDHLIYRGVYVPVKGTIDGDLCEQYFTLPIEKKRSIASELERSVREVERKISGMRARYAF